MSEPQNRADGANAVDARFAQIVKKHRLERGLSQRAMARELSGFGVEFHQTQIKRIESGERPVRLSEAYVFAAALGLSLDELMRPEREDEAVSASLRNAHTAAIASARNAVHVFEQTLQDATEKDLVLMLSVQAAKRHGLDVTAGESARKYLAQVAQAAKDAIGRLSDAGVVDSLHDTTEE